LPESKSKTYLSLHDIKEHKRSLRNAVINKDLDLWDAAMALEAISQLLESYEMMESHFLAIFGTKRKSDKDQLNFCTDLETQIIYHQDHKRI